MIGELLEPLCKLVEPYLVLVDLMAFRDWQLAIYQDQEAEVGLTTAPNR